MFEGVSCFALLKGVIGELEGINLEFLNLKFVKTKSKDFEKFFKGINDLENNLFLNHLSDQLKYYSGHSYALIPINKEKIIEYESIYSARNLCLLVEPSNLTITGIFGFRKVDEFNCDFSFFDSFKYAPLDFNDSIGNHFIAKNISYINDFIKSYHANLQNLKYLKAGLGAYAASFNANITTMKYLNLCIVLESIVNGKTELSYRIRRNVAVLLSEDDDYGDRIFSNIKNIYDLRSKIVHAGTYKRETVKEEGVN